MLNQKKIGRYEVVSVMGQGAMGTVYKASDPVIERVVAIKTINLELSREERAEFEERFYREAKSAGRLNHPNIVTIYDVGETGDAAYIAMEYIEGESLRDVLDSGVVLPLKRICQIAVQIANALNYAHENNVVHRDIKPANIMISRNRDVKIMDFGIALIPTGSRTQAGTVLGSPKYMAPEQLAGKATDGRADIFSLGAVLYEMLTGATPFNGENLSAIMYKILNDEPTLPSELNARVPKVFDRIIAKALAKRPEDRYQTARDFSRDIRSEEVLATLEPQPSAQKNAAVFAKRHAEAEADPLDVKTEIMLPPPQHRNTRRTPPPAPASKTGRHALLLAIPLAALAAYLVLKPADQAPAPADASPEVQASGNGGEQQPAAAAQAPQTPAAAPVPATAADTTPAAAATATANATLSFAIAPWGEVFVDGRKAGISPPLTRLELPPGKHDIEIRNGTFAAHHVKVNLDSDESVKIKHIFK
jgi:serine/threonine-protein kinase